MMELTSYNVEMVNHNLSAMVVTPNSHDVLASPPSGLTPPTETEPFTGTCTNYSWEIGKVRDLFLYY